MLEGYSPSSRQMWAHGIGRDTGQMYRRVFAYASRKLASEGFGRGEQVVLRILSEQDGRSLAGIADAGALDRGNVTRIVSALEKDGYLRRENDPAARHGYKVFLTEKGTGAALRVRETLDAWNERLFAGLDDAALEALASSIGALARRSDELWGACARGELGEESAC